MLFDITLLPQLQKPLTGYIRNCSQPTSFLETQNIICPRIYDQFVTNNVEYIILPIQMVEVSVKILQDNNFTVVTHNDYHEPICIAYKSTTLPDTYTNTHNIVMCVYFLQNNNQEIDTFFDYYYKQGVEKIFLYYCGKLNDRPNLPSRDYVEYCEWSYVHRVLDESINTKIHFSQVPLYNMFAKKIGMHSNWSIYCDLDEYLYHPINTLKEYLADKQNHLFTQHRFSMVIIILNYVCTSL